MAITSYVRLPAPRGTEHLVEHTWVLRAEATGTPWRALLVPNGRPSVVVCLGEPGERIEPRDHRRTPNGGTVAGVRRLPVVLEQSGEAWYVGARLRAYGLAALGLDALFVDDAAPLDALATAGLDPVAFTEAIRSGADDEERAEQLARSLADAVADGEVPGDRVAMIDRAVAVLAARRGLVTATDLARAVGVPAPILDTAVDEHVGVGLDDFTAMTRFHHFVGGHGGPEQGEAAVRVLARYRLTGRTPRETLRFTGLTPTRYAEVRDAVTALLAPSPVV
ncbi:MAG: hypothetical protein GX593_11655 [Actinomycetales bacterium]|nr:hypothetical protein [Actinomycetales bacterium]